MIQQSLRIRWTSQPTLRWVAVGLACGVSTACTDAEDPAAPSPLEAAVEEEASHAAERVGASDPDLPLYLITTATFDGRSRIHVLDPAAGEAHVFDTLGTRVGGWGRQGDGPGEYRMPWRVQAVGGDTLVVYDRELRRVTLLGPDGDEVYDTFTLDGGGLGAPQDILPLSTEAFFGWHEPAAVFGSPESDDEAEGFASYLTQPAESAGDTLVTFSPPANHVQRREDGLTNVTDPFGPRPLLGAGPEGRLHRVSTDSAAVWTYNDDGEEVAHFHVDVEPESAEPEKVRQWLEAEPALELFEEEIRAGAERLPVLRGFHADRAARLWLGVRGEGVPEGRWIAVSPEGDPHLTVDLPPEEAVQDVRGDLMVTAPGFLSLPSEIPRIRVYRIHERQ